MKNNEKRESGVGSRDIDDMVLVSTLGIDMKKDCIVELKPLV